VIFEYYPDTDTLYILLRDEPGTETREVAPDTVLDFNKSGELVGIEVEHASQRVDLATLHVTALPVRDFV
jgi:uncharacterized protein YuzE